MVAAGGDGTVNAVAIVVRHGARRVPLGSRTISGRRHSARRRAGGNQRGNGARRGCREVNEEHFLNNSSPGHLSRGVRMREEEQRHGQGKWAALAHGGLAPRRAAAHSAAGGERKVVTAALSPGNNLRRSRGRGSRLALDARTPRRARVRSTPAYCSSPRALRPDHLQSERPRCSACRL